MITHKVLAAQQGYERLLDILADGLRDKEDPFLLFFMNVVEPIYHALEHSNMQLLFDTLGIKRYPITQKREKNKWMELKRTLNDVRQKKSIDVLDAIVYSNLIPIPPLDGSKLLLEYLPVRYLYKYEETVERYGFYILLGLVLTGVIGQIINPLAQMYLLIVNSILNIIF